MEDLDRNGHPVVLVGRRPDRTNTAARDARVDSPFVAEDPSDPPRLLLGRRRPHAVRTRVSVDQNFVVTKRTMPVTKMARQTNPTTKRRIIWPEIFDFCGGAWSGFQFVGA